jgi:hemerythrin-like metal-binding protein
MHDPVDLYNLQGAPVAEILDRQHSEIRRKRQNLRTAIVEGMGMDQIVACAQDLMDTTLEHFQSEESAMDESKFEGVAIHKQVHAQMVETVHGIRSNLERRKIGAAVELMTVFVERLDHHLEYEDGAFGRNLRELQ